MGNVPFAGGFSDIWGGLTWLYVTGPWTS